MVADRYIEAIILIWMPHKRIRGPAGLSAVPVVFLITLLVRVTSQEESNFKSFLTSPVKRPVDGTAWHLIAVRCSDEVVDNRGWSFRGIIPGVSCPFHWLILYNEETLPENLLLSRRRSRILKVAFFLSYNMTTRSCRQKKSLFFLHLEGRA